MVLLQGAHAEVFTVALGETLDRGEGHLPEAVARMLCRLGEAAALIVPGVPLAALSGRLAAATILEDLTSAKRSPSPATSGGMSTA